MSTTETTTATTKLATLSLKSPTSPPAQQPTPTHSKTLSSDKFSRVWRGDKDGKIQMKGVPKFDDPYEEREWVKGHMAAAFRYWGKLGFGEGAAGHITCKDPVLKDHYWMNPLAVHFSSMTKSKLVLVGPDGYVTPHGAQLPINTAGFVIHTAIHAARPDALAAAHCHSLHGKTWSVFGKPIDILQQDACLFYNNLSVYENFGGVALAMEEGVNIAKSLGERNRACILQNHGLLTIGRTIDECIYLFGLLDRHCHMQLMVEAAAANEIPKTIISDEDAAYTQESTGTKDAIYIMFQPEYELLLEETNGAFLK